MDAPEKGTKDQPEAVFHGPSAGPMCGHPVDVRADVPAMSQIQEGFTGVAQKDITLRNTTAGIRQVLGFVISSSLVHVFL
jgi:hypothetical protein